MSRMFDRIANSKLVIGTVALFPGDECVEIMGHVGLDFACMDMMITSIGWENAASMIRAANRFEMTPWIRLQGYPWGKSGLDPRTAADVLRALSIGAEVVTVSVDTPEAVEAILEPASDRHRRVYLYEDGELADVKARRAKETLVFPMLESKRSIESYDEILAVPGLQAVFLAMGDLPRMMGYPGQPEHPAMREFVMDLAGRARERGIIVLASTGARQHTPEAIAETTTWMWEAGVQVVWIPYFSYILYKFYRATLDQIDGRLGEARRLP